MHREAASCRADGGPDARQQLPQSVRRHQAGRAVRKMVSTVIAGAVR
jgi:hypothetical protein